VAEKAKKVVDDIARGEKTSAAVGRARARSGGEEWQPWQP
jgi:hypothetical protein